MQAVSLYLIVENIKESKTIAGLEINDDIDSDNRYIKAKIISKGDQVPDVINVNNIIYYDKHAGHSITYKEKLHQVIQMKDVVIVE